MFKKLYLLFAMLLAAGILVAGCGGQGTKKDFHYKTAEELKTMLEQGEPIHIVDIQVEEEYKQGHIKGSVATFAYPVKSDEDKAKLDAVLPELQKDEAPIVIVCPRGAGGAERTYQYLQEKGFPEGRLFILEKGWAGWDYREWTATGSE